MPDNVEKRPITSELSESYLDYAMSVIVARALPDVRDGLKPVHRRILWDMWSSGLTHLAKFRKSANVIGQVLARYHPHGDVAVYDALVRMAQDFSLRYPLVQGQGNFGCFTKDTKVKLTDGRDLSFGELIKGHEQGKRNYTYTINKLGLVSFAEIQHPRLTRKNAEIVAVTLDNGARIRCTPDHRFMLKDGSYREAQALRANDSLMPFYERFSEKTDRLNREGYVLVYQPKKDEWVPAHHLADNFNLTQGAYKKSDGRVRHHIDFNKLNNNPDNVRRVQWGEHWRIHYLHASAQHKNPEYREKLAAGRNTYWADPRNKERKAVEVSLRNAENWQKADYREKMRRFLSEVNKQYIAEHPEKRKEYAERGRRTLKRLWQIPEYRALFHEKIVQGNKNHTTNQTGKLKFLRVCEAAVKEFTILNERNYATAREKIYPYGAAPLWETGLDKYFQSNPELVRAAVSKNHKVVRVEDSGREDVYDLTIEGTHNFALADGVFVHNSVDGDSAAAYRYTEARLSKVAEEMLQDIEKETVEWQPNYDATREEPKVLPAKIPNLLVNGTLGIAVGMATSIPPHNLVEVVDATLLLAEKPNAAAEDLLQYVKGPDFPTGGVMYDRAAIRTAYATGRGAVTTRAKAEIVERKKGESARAGFDIVITEIPYQVNKSELVKHIATLVQDKRLEGIRDLRDESDREGLRIVVELKSDAAPQKVLNQLYQHSDLQKDFHFNMIALRDGIQPELFSLKEMLLAFIEHRREVVKRRTQFDLRRAEERAHILEGLAKALDAIDKVIATIKKSKDRDDARANLIKGFKLSELQAIAILEMRLQTLAALEREKIEAELKEKRALIKELTLILKSPARMLEVVKKELAELKTKYGEARRTHVVNSALKEMTDEDLVPDEEAIVTFSSSGYVKRVPPDSFKIQRRGGKGLIGSDVAEEDFLLHFFRANTHDRILFFTDRGRVFETRAYEIPAASRTSKGKAVHNFLELPAEENVSAIVNLPSSKTSNLKPSTYLVMITKNGIVKKTSLKDFENIRRTGIIGIALKKGDVLKWVRISKGDDQVVLVTEQGQSIRFAESQARPMGRGAAGVRAIRLRAGDAVAGCDIVKKGDTAKLLVVMANGFGKQTPLKEYKTQNRGGSGIKTANVTAKTGKVVAGTVVNEEVEMLALSAKGQVIRTELKSVRQTGRSAQGVRIMNMGSGDRIAGVVVI